MPALVPDRFVLLLAGTVLLATIVPAGGAAGAAVGWTATATVMLLFFLHGVRLAREALIGAVTDWRLHLAILAATFVMFPLLGVMMVAALPGVLTGPLAAGFLFLCALPSTVQSSIAFTSIARGNVAGAVSAAAASNLIGIALTPLIAGLLTSAHGGGARWADVGHVAVQLLLPFVAGHLARPWLGGWAARNRRLLALTDRGTVLLSVYAAFSAAVLEGLWTRVPPGRLAALLGACLVLLALVLAATRFGARALGFSREDEIAILFCGSKKSLVSGVPMARVLFAGPDLGLTLLPVMLFHQAQLMACAWAARGYAARAE